MTKERTNMESHLRKYAGKPLYQCHLCPAVFTHNCSLVHHIRTHTGERPFSCDHCSASFLRKATLNDHLHSHTGERPYSCDHCSASFSHRKTLTQHLLTHTGERPFCCVHCNASFSHRTTLKRHLSTHSRECSFSCVYCSASFAQKGKLSDHISRIVSSVLDEMRGAPFHPNLDAACIEADNCFPLVQYADDTSILAPILCPSTSEDLQEYLMVIDSWIISNHLKLSPDKCSVMKFLSARLPAKPSYTMRGIPLPTEDSLKILGVTFTSTLDFSLQVASVVAKARRVLSFVSRFSKPCGPATFALLYTSLVLPILEYGFAVWSPNQQHLIARIESVQRRASRILYARSIKSPPADYVTRLKMAKWRPQRQRRAVTQMCLLCRLLDGSTAPWRTPPYRQQYVCPKGWKHQGWYSLQNKEQGQAVTTRVPALIAIHKNVVQWYGGRRGTQEKHVFYKEAPFSADSVKYLGVRMNKGPRHLEQHEHAMRMKATRYVGILIICIASLSSCGFAGFFSSEFPEQYSSLVTVESGWHTCRQCTYMTKERTKMESHLNKHAGKPLYQCHLCPAVFTQNCSLVHHIRTHTGERPFSCDHCNATFTKKALLKIHLRTHTGERPYTCDQCNKSFSQKTTLIQHLRLHTGERPFSCNHCSASFSQKATLNDHLHTHTGERPFSCDYCNKSFSQKASLTQHLRIHTGERPFSCDHCSATFIKKSNLTSHLRIHTGERPYSCDYCSASFPHKTSLMQHLNTHTGERPFSCDHCDASFSHRGTLVNHLLTHTGERPFSCVHCNACFSKKANLRDHISRLHL
ncbi:zinc finger protein 26-like [Rhipicephalus sanguineus]|uniref:zinc finger protein 26-like n=1 Tax=Rhipicephalus sanguineus TaxID=34632 RepID=UPI0020C33910|nr:zinc finger protein 26-like [Rhipicephalus sanguineus]